MYFDSSYILVIIGAAICALASLGVNTTFKKYAKVVNKGGLTAYQAAEYILHASGIDDVRIERISGSLTDHYSPNEKVLRLSDSVINSTSVAAVGVAAHECGHAIQHKVGYGPLELRSLSAPIANIGSRLSWPVLLIGLLLGNEFLAKAGVYLFSLVVLFQLITLPVEFNASGRALEILQNGELLVGDELRGAKKVLRAAAMTYVASLFSTILQFIRLIGIAKRTDRD